MNEMIPNLTFFLPVLVRMSGLFVFTPFFSTPSFPIRAKVGTAVMMALIVYFSRDWQGTLPDNELSFGLFIVREGLVGFVIGIILNTLFAGIQAAGQLIGYEMGFSLVSSYDPNFGQLEIISQIKFILALLIFVLMDGHHKLVEVLVESYDIIPFGTGVFSTSLVDLLSRSVGFIFDLALRLSAPVLVPLWLTSLFLAILNRVLPQMNIFMVDFPVKIGVGLFSLAVSLPFIFESFEFHMRKSLQQLPLIIGLLKG